MSFTGQAVTTSGRYVLASDNKGACVEDQTPQKKSATGTGTLTFSSNGIPPINLNIPEFFGTMYFSSFQTSLGENRSSLQGTIIVRKSQVSKKFPLSFFLGN